MDFAVIADARIERAAAAGHQARAQGPQTPDVHRQRRGGQALRKVLVPQLRPGMISGFILAFTMSLDDFAVTFFTRGTIGLETLSTYIYADARKGGLTPELRPLMTLIFLIILVLLLVINLRQSKLQKANE